MDFAKTQFLIEKRGMFTTIQKFRRKRQHMLFQGEQPVRLMTCTEWLEFKAAWPSECEEDNLSLRSVWTLVPIAS